MGVTLNMVLNYLSPTQSRMLTVLADGQLHRKKELHDCLDDGLSAMNAIHAHITAMRKVLRPKGQDIIVQVYSGERLYRLIRLLASPSKE